MSNLLTTVMMVNDATTTITTLLPLIRQAIADDRDVTDEELKLASTRLGLKIDLLDNTIEQSN